MPVPSKPLGLSVEPQDAPPRRVLRAADLRYLGAMRCPSDTRMDFTYGAMAGRTVNGRVHLLMPGNVTLHDPVYEFADTQSYHPVPEGAPRMALVRAWGDVYGGLRMTWDESGTMQEVTGRRPGGYYWHEGHQLLYWTYANSYNVGQLRDWCLGASALHADGTSHAYGPWRPEGQRIGPRACMRVAQSPTGEMLCGATLQSGNASSPWGPDLWAGVFPTAETPAGYGHPNLPLEKYLTYYPMIGRINEDGTYLPPMMACRRPGDYFWENFGPGTNKTNIDPLMHGGMGSWGELDFWHGVTWIDLPDGHGVVFTGTLAAGHEWYSTGLNNFQCTHGVMSPAQVTGPVSTAAYGAMWFYDPADLRQVRAGATTDYDVTPIETVNARDFYNLTTAPVGIVGSGEVLGGQYFDASTRKLYVCAPDADHTIPGYRQPLIHVFQVN